MIKQLLIHLLLIMSAFAQVDTRVHETQVAGLPAALDALSAEAVATTGRFVSAASATAFASNAVNKYVTGFLPGLISVYTFPFTTDFPVTFAEDTTNTFGSLTADVVDAYRVYAAGTLYADSFAANQAYLSDVRSLTNLTTSVATVSGDVAAGGITTTIASTPNLSSPHVVAGSIVSPSGVVSLGTNDVSFAGDVYITAPGSSDNSYRRTLVLQDGGTGEVWYDPRFAVPDLGFARIQTTLPLGFVATPLSGVSNYWPLQASSTQRSPLFGGGPKARNASQLSSGYTSTEAQAGPYRLTVSMLPAADAKQTATTNLRLDPFEPGEMPVLPEIPPPWVAPPLPPLDEYFDLKVVMYLPTLVGDGETVERLIFNQVSEDVYFKKVYEQDFLIPKEMPGYPEGMGPGVMVSYAPFDPIAYLPISGIYSDPEPMAAIVPNTDLPLVHVYNQTRSGTVGLFLSYKPISLPIAPSDPSTPAPYGGGFPTLRDPDEYWFYHPESNRWDDMTTYHSDSVWGDFDPHWGAGISFASSALDSILAGYPAAPDPSGDPKLLYLTYDRTIFGTASDRLTKVTFDTGYGRWSKSVTKHWVREAYFQVKGLDKCKRVYQTFKTRAGQFGGCAWGPWVPYNRSTWADEPVYTWYFGSSMGRISGVMTEYIPWGSTNLPPFEAAMPMTANENYVENVFYQSGDTSYSFDSFGSTYRFWFNTAALGDAMLVDFYRTDVGTSVYDPGVPDYLARQFIFEDVGNVRRARNLVLVDTFTDIRLYRDGIRLYAQRIDSPYLMFLRHYDGSVDPVLDLSNTNHLFVVDSTGSPGETGFGTTSAAIMMTANRADDIDHVVVTKNTDDSAKYQVYRKKRMP